MRKTFELDLKIAITYEEGKYIPAVTMADPNDCHEDESIEQEVTRVRVIKAEMMSNETMEKLELFLWQELVLNDDYFNEMLQDLSEGVV
jgi:hypothetical protein